MPQFRAIALPEITLEQGLYAGLLVAGFVARIWDVGSRAMHGDEAVHAWLAWNLFTGAGYHYDPVYHGPLQFLITSLFFFLFGDSNTTGRLMAVLFGSALIVLPYFLRHWMGRGAALLAAAFLAFSPAFLYVSRLERDDIFTAVFALTMAIALFQFVRTVRIRYFYLGAVAIALSLSAMENTYITIFVFGTFVLLVFISEYLASDPNSRVVELWKRTGNRNQIDSGPLLAVAVALVIAFGLTVLTGFYLPVPLVLAITMILLVNRQTSMGVAEDGEAPFLHAVRSVTRTQWINAVTLMVAILFLTFSTMGTNPKGIWDASQPFFNTANACPGNSFPLNPCRKDLLGGLFYWLSQHHVHRGGQPWFYYTLLFGLYEQIAVIFGIGGVIWTLRRPTFFRTFLVYWAIVMFGVYSWAGEKFSWLMIHPLLPVTLLAAMFVVHAWQGRQVARYATIGVFAVLALLELHSTFVLNYLNGADPVEMMVYVQSAPDTPKVANDILTTSYKVTGGDSLHVSIDSLDTWPFAWYLRHMTNVGYPGSPQLLQKPFATDPIIIVDETHQAALAPLLRRRYTGHRYRLRWWFPEDYKSLSWGSFARDLVNPGDWKVIEQWLIERRPFGPRQAVWFYYYVKTGLVSPY
ncbi:MAG: TIGR03663 family protein [Chloroflexota bacterium]|nr:TIGR03663 family protein [Chloroflexota bacterium]